MTIIVEDGTGVTGAESYVTVAFCTAYHAARNNTAWAAIANDTLREGYLRLATDYMVQAYRGKWKGLRAGITQALDWPRRSVVLDDLALYYAVPYTIVPTEVMNACCILALKASAGDLAPDLDRATASEIVGPITTTYFAGSPQHTRYRSVDLLLKPYIDGTDTNGQLVRG
ncbi:DnaT-like ssDNA-binding protein [Solimicrobium silvestre]|uniref:Putative DnaT-like domain-containing protein n=1 Tax=Solimicrobium silvestre TaxID=2099400 RepID=A0A2S9GY82_9BURK|nr:DnaT-like ssDNA-binding protein [Solimicrobium silvestre]PRC92671.1 hypothetical protein S2091_2726 [Solimicrobium silvestre]